ncbi:MAG: TadE/TadG family type IV pilus assembly protein [bacterium]
MFKRRTVYKIARRFGLTQTGATAVEFAMVFPLFIGLVFSVFEIGIYFYKVSVIEEAVSKAARKVRTGYKFEAADPLAPGACLTEKDCLYKEICDIVDTFGPCNNSLAVEVTVFSDFATLAADTSSPVCVSDAGYDYNTVGFDKGAQQQIVRLRACFEVKTTNPGLGLKLSTGSNGKRKIIATTFFQNEAYN